MSAVPLSQLAVQLRPEDNIAVAARHLSAGQAFQPWLNQPPSSPLSVPQRANTEMIGSPTPSQF